MKNSMKFIKRKLEELLEKKNQNELDDEIEFVSFEEFKKKVGINDEKTKTKS